MAFAKKNVGETNCRIDYGCGCAEDGERRSTIAGLLECCGKSVPVNDFYCADCGNGTCTLGENKSNCPTDCYDDSMTCLSEGETYPASSDINKCCGNLTNVKNTCFDSGLSTYWTCTKCGDNICGFGEDKYNCPTDCLVIKNCAIIGDPSEICDCECNNYCIKTGYLGGGSCQNIGTIGRYIEMANGPSCSQGLHENYNQKLVCTCENCEK